MEIKVLHQIMDWNEDVSEDVRARLAEYGICMINVMGSPGAGKTSLITSLIGRLKDKFRIGVIEGDIAGQVDADQDRRPGGSDSPAEHGRRLSYRSDEHSEHPPLSSLG